MFLAADIFLDCLLLLLADNSARNRGYVESVLRIKDDDDKRRDIRASDDALKEFYIRLTRDVLATHAVQEDTKAMQMLLLKVKSDPIKEREPVVIDILTDVLSNDTPLKPDDLTKYLNRIRNVLVMNAFEQGLKRSYGTYNNISSDASPETQMTAMETIAGILTKTVQEFDNAKKEESAATGESYICMSNKDSLKRAVDTFVTRSVNGILTMGLQGFNMTLGKRKGIGLGETFVVAACSHNYKTGLLVSMMVWCVIYNTHIMPPDGKKFLVYFVSLENETFQNLMDVFRMLYCRVNGKEPDDMSSEAIVEWLYEFFSKYGIELVIDRYEPHEFTYKKYISKLTHFTELGYELLSFILDYMSEARGVDAGDTVSATGRLQLIGENYVKFCSTAKTRGYMMATGHQLTKDADRVASQYRMAVKKFNASMFSFSPDVFRTVDIVEYAHIEVNVNGHSFLTLQNRKNRYCKDTPEEDKFCAYPFTPFGILDDLNKDPQFVKDIDAWGIQEGSELNSIDEAALF